jgi:plastocyanin
MRALSRPFIAGLFATLLVSGVAACGDDDDADASGDGGTTTTADGSGGQDGGAGTDEGTIVAVDFELAGITVAPGAELHLQNDGEQNHTATSDEDGLFDLEADAGSSSEEGTAPDEPGEYPFHCEIHPSMTATLTAE